MSSETNDLGRIRSVLGWRW